MRACGTLILVLTLSCAVFNEQAQFLLQRFSQARADVVATLQRTLQSPSSADRLADLDLVLCDVTSCSPDIGTD